MQDSVFVIPLSVPFFMIFLFPPSNLVILVPFSVFLLHLLVPFLGMIRTGRRPRAGVRSTTGVLLVLAIILAIIVPVSPLLVIALGAVETMEAFTIIIGLC